MGGKLERMELEKYCNHLNRIKDFRQRNPTLTHQRRALGKGERLVSPDEVEQFVYGQVQTAGFNLVESIHQDIFNTKPPHEQQAILDDLREVALEARQEKELKRGPKPELNDEYLRSIGREDLICWPSGTD